MAKKTDNLEIEDIILDDDTLNSDAEDSYQIKIQQFEGPLDLLLHLVKRAKIKICDIYVSEITQQYLEYLEELKAIDLDKASEFLGIAAYLLEIKAKALLPKPETQQDDDTDDGRELIHQLELYELYKNASEEMKKCETVGVFYRQPDPTVGDERVVLKDMTTLGLEYAFMKIRERVERQAQTLTQHEIVRDTYTVDDKMQLIADLLSIKSDLLFDDLFGESTSVIEVITTFQALLELMKDQVIEVTQTDVFGQIYLQKKVMK